MATSKVVYLNELRTEATHLSSGTKIITDAPVDNRGKGQAFSPTDTAATSLATCMLTMLGIYSQDHGINMTGSSAGVTKVMSKEGPRRIVQIDVDLQITTEKLLDENQKVIFERIAKTCPVALSLHPDIAQNINISFR